MPEVDTAPIGVVVPTYNRKHLILETLNSICAQSLKPELLVVVDDGSEDGTEEVLSAWKKEAGLDFEFIYHYQENRGVSGARNTGLQLARNCQWIAFLDSDDVWPEDLLSRLYTKVSEDPQYIACSAEASESCFELDHTLISSRLLSHEGAYHLHGPHGLMIAPVHISATIFRADIALLVNGFDEKLQYGEDKLFAMSVSCHGLWGRVDGTPTLYRVFKKSLGVDQLSNNPHQNSRIRYARMLDKYLKPFSKSDKIWHRGLRSALSKAWYRAGRHLAKSGHYSWASGYYFRAARYRPLHKACLRGTLMYFKSKI